MKLRIKGKEVCDLVSPLRTGNTVEFLVKPAWDRIPKGDAEIVDDRGQARSVVLTARNVGFREILVTATFTDQREQGAT